MAQKASDEFRKKLRELTKKAACGRQYVLIHSLKAWMNQAGHKEELIGEAYSDSRFSKETLYKIDEALLVFSILLELKCERYIECFLRNNILDSA
jgi:hypothetical protein